MQLDQHKWSYVAMLWQPMLDCTSGGVRAQARPRKKWEDDIKAYLDHVAKRTLWVLFAADADRWRKLEEDFLDYVKS